MKKININKALRLTTVAAAVSFVLLSLFSYNTHTQFEQEVYAQSVPCPHGNGWVKYELNDPDKIAEHDAGSGNLINEVCVFGGNIKEFFTQDETRSCWTVNGIGTQSASAQENWPGNNKGSDCKDISNVSFKVGNIPSSTPTATPSATPTVTPTDVPVASPTPTDEPEGGASPTPTLSPTPATDATVTPTPTGTVEGVSAEREPEVGNVLGISALAATGSRSDWLIFIGLALITFSLTFIASVVYSKE
jgi:hypothetical protein